MKRLIVALAAGIALWSCGGSGGSGSGLNPAFTGAWNGTTTVTLQGFAPYSYSAHVNIAVSGSTGNMWRCPAFALRSPSPTSLGA